MNYETEFKKLLEGVESLMGEQVDHQDLPSLTGQLIRACNALQYQGKIMGLATYLFDKAKGEVASQDHGDMKLELLRLKIAGLLAKESANYERAERVTKALPAYIDGLRSIISQLKTELKHIQ
jgi:hypothetical protein